VSEPNKAAQAILAVMQTVTKAHKSGKNQKMNYKFVEHATLVPDIRNALIEQGCIMVPVAGEHTLVPKADGKGWHGTVSHRFNIIHCESGDTIQVGPVAGEGFDSGDKTIPKANTNAHKYALLLTFMLPSDDDPEGDEKTDIQPGRASSPKTEVNATAASSAAPSDVLDQTVPWGMYGVGGAEGPQTWRWVCENKPEYITGYIIPKAERVDPDTKAVLKACVDGTSVPSTGTPIPPEIVDANDKMLSTYWRMVVDESGLDLSKDARVAALLEYATGILGRDIKVPDNLTDEDVAMLKKRIKDGMGEAVRWLKEDYLPF